MCWMLVVSKRIMRPGCIEIEYAMDRPVRSEDLRLVNILQIFVICAKEIFSNSRRPTLRGSSDCNLLTQLETYRELAIKSILHLCRKFEMEYRGSWQLCIIANDLCACACMKTLAVYGTLLLSASLKPSKSLRYAYLTAG